MKVKTFIYFFILGLMLYPFTNAHGQVRADTAMRKAADAGRVAGRGRSFLEDTLRKNGNRDTAKAGLKKKMLTFRDSTARQLKRDTILIPEQMHASPAPMPAEIADSENSGYGPDSIALTAVPPEISSRSITGKLLLKNQMINTKAAPVYFIMQARNSPGKEFLFYTLCAVLLILGVFRTFYSHYFNNLFRVFFNTSLRQMQLTDQLLQAKLPSFILNIFFTITSGIYIWLLFMHFRPPRIISGRLLLPFCILTVVVLYVIKYSLLKFMGWVSDIRQATDSYIFVIFLINKITGILLVPFIILLAFAVPQWINTVTLISLLVLALFLLSRYIKSYSVVQKKIQLNHFHFIIYILGAEIIPMMLIYKVAVDYLI